MNRLSLIASTAVLVTAALGAGAQQPAPPPPPAFAASNLSEAGARALAANCAACHGTQGRPVAGSPVAVLAGRSSAEIADIMAQFKDGKRPATVMHQIAKGYSEAEINAIANHFSRLAR